MKAYIDFDIIAYRSAASCEPTKTKEYREPLELAIQRADDLMLRILADVDTDEYIGWLSGADTSYRRLLYPPYKAHRDLVRKPEYLHQVKDFLIDTWNAKVASEYEADDALGIAWDEVNGVLCSIDKDFKQLPGRHYNFVTYQFEDVDEYAAAKNFWESMLIGDRADNVPGIPGIGKVKAPRILEGLSPREMKERVKELYLSYDMDFQLNYNLLRILRTEEEWYNIENLIRQCTNKQKQLMTI